MSLGKRKEREEKRRGDVRGAEKRGCGEERREEKRREKERIILFYQTCFGVSDLISFDQSLLL